MAGKWVSSGSLANVWVIPETAALDADTLAWVAAVVANGGSVSAVRQIIVNNLIVGLKADGIWTVLDRLWLFAAENEASALTDLVGRTLATAVNAPTFTADDGYTFDGATNYINTLFVPATDGVAYTLNSGSFGVYCLTDVISGRSPMGIIQGVTNFATQFFYNGNLLCDMNDPGAVDLTAAGTNVQGFVAATRTAANARALYKNGVSIASDAQTSGATTLATIAFLVAARNIDGSPLSFADNTIAAAFLGGGMNATDNANLSTRTNAYMTSVGCNVY